MYFVKRRALYGIVMNIFVYGNYVSYYVWSPYILTQYSSLTKFLKLWPRRNARRFPSTCMFKTYVSTIQCSVRILFIVRLLARTPERCLVKFKMRHSKWCYKICNQTFSYRFIVAAILDQNIEHLFGANPVLYTL